MNTCKTLFLCATLLFTYACSHPLEIRGKGEGDISSATGQRNCSLEEYQAEAPNCAQNDVIFEYDETYTGTPRAGSQFRRWGNYCGSAPNNECSFYFRGSAVKQGWFQTAPPLQAVFRPTVNTGFNTVLMGNGFSDPIAAGIDSHALNAGFSDHTTAQFFAPGDLGAPEAFWNDVGQRASIEAVLDVGDVDVIGMTYSPVYPTLAGYTAWIDYALEQNPDTRFLIATPWDEDPGSVSNTQFEADFDATHTLVHTIVDALREAYPGVDIYCVPSGESAVALYNLHSAGNLPEVSSLVGPQADAVFQDTTGNPGDILVELGQLLWFSAIYDVDLSTYAYTTPYPTTDLKLIAADTLDLHPTAYDAPPEVYPDADGDGIPDLFDPIDLVDLLTDTTRGVFQVDPGEAGALTATATGPAWQLSPLQIIDKLSAGMDVTANAERILLAQTGDMPQDLILLATLAGTDIDGVMSGAAVAAAPGYLGYSLWSITGTDLQIVGINSINLAIGSRAALERALDVYEGFAAGVEVGAIEPWLLALDAGFPNSFVYVLPAQYGAVAAPGSGASSLSQASGVNAAFSVSGDDLGGVLNFFTPNANSYVTRLTTLLSGYTAPPVLQFSNVVSVNLFGLSVADDVRPLLKTLVHEMNGVDYTDAVSNTGNTPWLNFSVGEDPNSIFINFEFAGATERANFEAAHLPAGFTLAPVKILAADTPKYFLVLNIYQSTGGLVEGARAEWSVFIDDPDTSEPRFLVVQAAAETISADSVNLLTDPEPVDHLLTATAVDSYVGVVDPMTEIETTYFSSSIDWPQVPETLVDFAREFAAANDYIFWGNGVADRTLYNSSVHNRAAVLIPNGDISFVDNSPWAAFVNPSPVHTLVYRNGLDIVISPWWNLDKPYLDVTPAYLQTLLGFRNGFYPATVQGIAASAIRGEGVVLNPSFTNDSLPTARYHFPLLNAPGLIAAAAGAGAYTPVALALFDGETAGHFVTLSVYKREGDACGARAEWTTYVEDGVGRPMALKLDGFAVEPCLDPAVLMTPAVALSQNIAGNTLNTLIESPFINFEAAVDLTATSSLLVSQNWLETQDRQCSLNGVCDKGYYDGGLLLTPADVADTPAVQIITMETPWDVYIDGAGGRAAVRTTPVLRAHNLWRNIRSYAGSAPIP